MQPWTLSPQQEGMITQYISCSAYLICFVRDMPRRFGDSGAQFCVSSFSGSRHSGTNEAACSSVGPRGTCLVCSDSQRGSGSLCEPTSVSIVCFTLDSSATAWSAGVLLGPPEGGGAEAHESEGTCSTSPSAAAVRMWLPPVALDGCVSEKGSLSGLLGHDST